MFGEIGSRAPGGIRALPITSFGQAVFKTDPISGWLIDLWAGSVGTAYIRGFDITGKIRTGVINFVPSPFGLGSASELQIGLDGFNAADTLTLLTGSVRRVQVSGQGQITVNKPDVAVSPIVIKSATALSMDIWAAALNGASIVRGMDQVGTRTGYLAFSTGNSGGGGATETSIACDGTTASDLVSLVTGNGNRRLSVNGVGAVSISAPSAGNALQVNGVGTYWTGQFTGSASSGNSYGVIILAGTLATDTAFRVRNQGGTTTFLTIDGTGGCSILKLAMNNQTPVAMTTGFGTPTGNVIVANFPGATATLVQCSNTIAELLVLLKAFGLIGT